MPTQYNSSGRHWLIIPIETKVRELHAKCLLAFLAADAGLNVVLGDLRVLADNLHRLPVGIYLDKTISRTGIGHYQRLKQLGFGVAAWCEEGLVYRNKRAYQVERISPSSLSLLDTFFAWGGVQKDDVLEVMPEAIDKMVVAGNPRFDVLRPEFRLLFAKDAEKLVDRFGPYILINTNFSRFNHFRGSGNVIRVLRRRGIITTSEDEIFYHQLGNHLGALFDAFRQAIPLIAQAFPDVTIVVRPHPSENHDRWRTELADLSNVVVIHEGSVIPWILGAKAVVHNSCTTGVEAFLLDRPTIAYLPVTDNALDSVLPNGVSDVACDTDSLLALVRRALNDGKLDPRVSAERRALLARYVASADGAFAYDRIIPVLRDLIAKQNRSAKTNAAHRLGRAVLGGRMAVIRAARRLRVDRQSTAYMVQKFPGISLDEVTDIFRAIAESKHSAAPAVTAHPFLPDSFVVEARQPERQGLAASSFTAAPQDADCPAA